MNTFKRGFGRLAASVLLTLALAAVGAASAGATTVNLRVEAPNETLFNGSVNTGARSVDDLSPNCAGTTISSNAVSKPTTVTAVADWIAGLGFAAPVYSTAYGAGFICQIGAYQKTETSYWLLKINNQDSPPPAGYVTASDQLFEGDSVLVYYSDGSLTGSLDLKIPAAAKPGDLVSGVVNSWSNFSGDVKSAAAGVTVSGGGATTTTANDGSFSLSIAQPGSYLVSATNAGAVRGSAWITIDPQAATPAPIVKINRFVKCNATYSRHSRLHRRCVRIVRAKQAAARRK